MAGIEITTLVVKYQTAHSNALHTLQLRNVIGFSIPHTTVPHNFDISPHEMDDHDKKNILYRKNTAKIDETDKYIDSPHRQESAE